MLWNHLRRVRRALNLASRLFHLDDEIGRSIQDLAERMRRPEAEITAELLTFALARRQAAEINLACWQELTPREQEIAALVCLNLTNSQIAGQLVISPETVKTHIAHVLDKFDLRSKAELRLLLADWDFSAWGQV